MESRFGRRSTSEIRVPFVLTERNKETSRPYIKKNMRDFIEVAWKEVLMLETEEAAQSRSKEFRQSTLSKKSRSPRTTRQVERRSLPAQQTLPYDPREQVRVRLKEGQRLREKLKREQEATAKSQQRSDAAWAATLQRMQIIDEKC